MLMQEHGDQEPENPARAVIEAIESYLKNKCIDLLDYIEITRQAKVKIALRGIYKTYTPSEEYPRFSDALKAALEVSPALLRDIGFEIIKEEAEEYLTISSKDLRELCRKVSHMD